MRDGGVVSGWRRGLAGSWAVAAVVTFTALCVVPETADAHFLDNDSVDDCEIRWEDGTVFDTERRAAQDAWEALKGDDCVDIAPDVSSTNADLEWKDVYRPDVSWAGRYEPELSADDILLNDFYMRTYTPCERKAVAMHELGHAHGLDHGPNVNVMRSGGAGQCFLGVHDIADYEALWGSRNPPRPPPPTHTPPTHTP